RRSSTNATLVSETVTGTRACRQVAPASSDSTTMPRSPTATTRDPARATSSITERAACGERSASRSSGWETGAANAHVAASATVAATMRPNIEPLPHTLGGHRFRAEERIGRGLAHDALVVGHPDQPGHEPRVAQEIVVAEGRGHRGRRLRHDER